LISADGASTTQLTFGPDYAMPSWSPDGTQMAFMYRDPTTGSTYIGTMNADGSNKHLITMGMSPMWSPDGSKIAFAALSPNTNTMEIWTINPDGSSPTQLTNTTGYFEIRPVWSPDGSQIADCKVSTSDHSETIWIMDSNGNNQRQLTTGTWNNLDGSGNVITTANDACAPYWNYTNKIVFWAGVEGQMGGQIWTINPDGTGRTQLTNVGSTTVTNDEPAWSPDGTKILFTTNRTNPIQPEMWMMNADGTNQHVVTQNDASPMAGVASWQPIP